MPPPRSYLESPDQPLKSKMIVEAMHNIPYGIAEARVNYGVEKSIVLIWT